MVRRGLISLGILLILSLSGLLITPAQSRWSMWVYQPEGRRLLRVDNTGQVIDTQDIPDAISPDNIVVSPSGNQLVYRDALQEQLIVLDLSTGRIMATISLSEIGVPHNQDDEFLLSDLAFSGDGTRLIYGERFGGLGWQLHVHDIIQDERLHTLIFNDGLASQYRVLHGGLRPVITHIEGDRITFTVDIDFPARIHSYHWFYEADILSETVAVSSLTTVASPNDGEIISAQFDGRFPADNEDFRYRWQQINSLQAYRGTEGRFPVFFDRALSFEQLWMVQAGERVLVEAYVDEIVTVWILLGRDGNEIRRYPVAGSDTTGTPDGYIYATAVGNQTAVVTVDTRNTEQAGATLWLQPGEWRIIWAGANQTQNPLDAWLQLAPAAQDPTGIIERHATPTQAPELPRFREVGMPVQIYVPDEGFLNLRDAPATNSNIVTLLESGSRGVIVEGPVEAEGYIWWQVSMDGRLGWVVESLPESLALIPPQVIASLTPTPTETASP